MIVLVLGVVPQVLGMVPLFAVVCPTPELPVLLCATFSGALADVQVFSVALIVFFAKPFLVVVGLDLDDGMR